MTVFAIVLATGFGLGHAPWIPGTFGAVLGVPMALTFARLRVSRQLIVAAVVTLLAVPVCGVAEDAFAEKDDGRIVADEFAAFPVAVLGLPVARHPGLLAFAFATSYLTGRSRRPSPCRKTCEVAWESCWTTSWRIFMRCLSTRLPGGHGAFPAGCARSCARPDR